MEKINDKQYKITLQNMYIATTCITKSRNVDLHKRNTTCNLKCDCQIFQPFDFISISLRRFPLPYFQSPHCKSK